VDPYKSPFARLLEDFDALEFWNNFIEKTEKEQMDLLNAFSEQYHKYKPDCVQDTNRSVGRVSARVKRTFKTKKNLSIEIVRDYELQLLEFFDSSPKDVYVKCPPTSFDRLLLKTIAHYHGLQIKSMTSLDESSKPSIEIFNTQPSWVPANCFLTDFIRQLR